MAFWLGGCENSGGGAAGGHHDHGNRRRGRSASRLERDPGIAAQLRIELAKISAQAAAEARRADIDMLSATLADTANARLQTISLAQAHSPVAYGAPTVSALVLVTFAIVMALALTRTMPAGSETILNMLLGSLAAMATSVVSYWVGSSAGSARKDVRLAQLTSGR